MTGPLPPAAARRILVLGHNRPLHERLACPGALPFEDLEHTLDDWARQGGRDGTVVLGVTRFNLFKLDRVLGFIGAHLPRLQGIQPPVLQPQPLATLRAELQATLRRLEQDLRLLALPLALVVSDPGLDELLAFLERTRPEDEPRLLRALGAVCETACRGPTRVLIDLMNTCNTNCVFCRAHTESIERRMKPARLDDELLTHLLDDLRELEVEHVSLVGSGEPSLHPFLPSFLRRTAEYGIKVDISMNGVRLPEALREALLGDSTSSITVSVSGPTRESYAKTHPGHGDDFARVVENCRELALARARQGAQQPALLMLHCINVHTADEIPRMVELAHEVGFDSVWIQMLHIDPATAHLKLTPAQAEALPARLEEARATAQRLGIVFDSYIQFQAANLDAADGTWSKQAMERLGCYVGWYFTYVDVHSYLNFCCGLKTIGRLGPGQRLKEIWFSEAYDRMRTCAKFLHASRNIEAPQNIELESKRFLFDDFCDCCDNHNFNEILLNDLAETGLERFLLPLRERATPEIASVAISAPGLPSGSFATGQELQLRLRFANPGRWGDVFPTVYAFEGNFLIFELEGPVARRAARGEWILEIPRLPYQLRHLRLVAGLASREGGLKRLFCLSEAQNLTRVGPEPASINERLALEHRVALRPLARPAGAPVSGLALRWRGGPPGTIAWGKQLHASFSVDAPDAPGLRALLSFEHVPSGYITVCQLATPLPAGSQRVLFTLPRLPLVGGFRVRARLLDIAGEVLGMTQSPLVVTRSPGAPEAGHGIVGLPHRWRSRLHSPRGHALTRAPSPPESADLASTAATAPVPSPDGGGGSATRENTAAATPVTSPDIGPEGDDQLQVLFEPLKIDIAITHRCNYRCLMCEFWRTIDDVGVPASQWVEFIDRAGRFAPVKLVCIGGGEPFLRTDMLEVVRACADRGIFVVAVTNGSLITESMARRIDEAGLDILTISLDGFAETHDHLRGVPGAFEKVTLAAQRVVARGGKTKCCISTFICEPNVDEMVRFVEHVCHTEGFDGINFQALQVLKDYKGRDWSAQSPLWPRDPDKVARVIDQILTLQQKGYRIWNPEAQLLAFAKFYRDPIGTSFSMLCKAGYSALPCDAQGRVRLCPKMEPIGNVFETPLDQLYHGQAAWAIRRMARTCSDKCHYLVNCYEEHRENA